jgi:hypothetical protein
MRIIGEWLQFDDGETRPILTANVLSGDDRLLSEPFLLDSGADRTVFSADLLSRLQTPAVQRPTGTGLVGIGGGAAFVVVETAIELRRDDDRPVTFRGAFAAFTGESTAEVSILGRDVLDNFDVILSRRRDEVLLLAGNHQYQVLPV